MMPSMLGECKSSSLGRRQIFKLSEALKTLVFAVVIIDQVLGIQSSDPNGPRTALRFQDIGSGDN